MYQFFFVRKSIKTLFHTVFDLNLFPILIQNVSLIDRLLFYYVSIIHLCVLKNNYISLLANCIWYSVTIFFIYNFILEKILGQK